MSSSHHTADVVEVCCAIVTVSDTRTADDDRGGDLLSELARGAGHSVGDRQIVPDEPTAMRQVLEQLLQREDVQVVLLTGGTGIAARDQTFETISELLDKPLPGYGELFRMLSFEEIGPKAMLSRAVGGLARGKVVLTMPGSPNAVLLAMERVILPTLGHLVREVTK